MRFIQHKKEAYYFYSFLSNFYDRYVNPLFWTERMRDEALELGRLHELDISVVDVGSGTGFTTEGIVRYVPAEKVTCIDQSPHQMARARKKPALEGCAFRVGDAENLPFSTDHFDRYVSAGSIEYWPDPQRGITEAYRVLKPGGRALLIGPLEPREGFARFMANAWMLFPKEEEYRRWFEEAGFKDIEVRYVSPHWVEDKEGYGLAITGVKPAPGPSPLDELVRAPGEKDGEMDLGRWVLLTGRLLLGSIAGFVFIPIALLGYFRSSLEAREKEPLEPDEQLNFDQVMAIIILLLLFLLFLKWIL